MSSNDGTEAAARARATAILAGCIDEEGTPDPNTCQACIRNVTALIVDYERDLSTALVEAEQRRVSAVALASQLAEVERERDLLLAGPRPWAEGDLPTAIQKGRRPGVFGARVASTRDILLMLQRSQPSVADVLDEAQRVVNERAARGDR